MNPHNRFYKKTSTNAYWEVLTNEPTHFINNPTQPGRSNWAYSVSIGWGEDQCCSEYSNPTNSLHISTHNKGQLDHICIVSPFAALRPYTSTMVSAPTFPLFNCYTLSYLQHKKHHHSSTQIHWTILKTSCPNQPTQQKFSYKSSLDHTTTTPEEAR